METEKQKMISAEEVATLLKISVKDAKKKMVMFERRQAGQTKQLAEDAEEILYHPVPIKDFGGYLGIDLEYFVENIQKNFLIRPATRGYILNYPAAKINPDNKLKLIRIPKGLRTLLTVEQKEEILNHGEFWRSSRFQGINPKIK